MLASKVVSDIRFCAFPFFLLVCVNHISRFSHRFVGFLQVFFGVDSRFSGAVEPLPFSAIVGWGVTCWVAILFL